MNKKTLLAALGSTTLILGTAVYFGIAVKKPDAVDGLALDNSSRSQITPVATSNTNTNTNKVNGAGPTNTANSVSGATGAMPESGVLVDLRAAKVASELNNQPGSLKEKLHGFFSLSQNHYFNAKTIQQDEKGNTHTRFKQSIQGVPVWGQALIIHQNAQGDIYSANGKLVSETDERALADFVQTLDQSVAAKDKVFQNAKSQLGHLRKGMHFSNESIELVLYVDKNQDRVIPAWSVSWLADMHEKINSNKKFETTKPALIVDASTGEILRQWESLQTATATGPGGNRKTGNYNYGTDRPALQVQQSGSTCSMITPDYKTVDYKNLKVEHSDAFTFTCPENTYKKVNGALSPLNDLHHYTGFVIDTFKLWYGGNPLPFQLVVGAHWGDSVENAYAGANLKFGDGGDSKYPLTTLDVVGHEFGHKVIGEFSALIYDEQSGAINESFADITGAVAKYRFDGQRVWLHGSDYTKNVKQSSRYMDHPADDNSSIEHADDYTSGLDVHYGSGVYNRAFYLLATTNGWNIRDTYKLFLEANKNFWVDSEDYDSALCGLLEASESLGFASQDVIDAFDQVGVTCSGFSIADVDGDGMEDGWEVQVGLDPTINDAGDDNDGDFLTNLEEFNIRSHPNLKDSDSDGLEDAYEFSLGTNPNLKDSDLDGLSDLKEDYEVLTDPTEYDTDGDNIPDGWEWDHKLDPFTANEDDDYDGDGLSNGDEFLWRTNPEVEDTDGDGLEDGYETATSLTSPLVVDSDLDGLSDGDEVNIHNTWPNRPDSDDDMLLDGDEVARGTKPRDPDSDDDGVEDGDEVKIYFSDPLDPDTDGDGMPDGWEVDYDDPNLSPTRDDRNGDFDADGLTNYNEYLAETRADIADTDGDRVLDGAEVEFGYSPTYRGDVFKDDDGDGWTNEQEIRLGSNPRNGSFSSLPQTPNIPTSETVDAYSILQCSEATDIVCSSVYRAEFGWITDIESRIISKYPPALFEISSSGWSYVLTSFQTDAASESYKLTSMLDTYNPYLNDANLWSRAASSTVAVNGILVPASLGQHNLVLSSTLNSSFNSRGGEAVFGAYLSSLSKSTISESVVFRELKLTYNYATDNDKDGMSDSWESANGIYDPMGDPDGDGAVNRQEFINKTDPNKADTDADGIIDGWEIFSGTSPTVADASQDPDNDGLTNEEENFYGSSPVNSDTDLDGVNDWDAAFLDEDDDGIKDAWEIRFGLNPDYPDDALQDFDGDRWLNIQEFYLQSHPLRSSGTAEGMPAVPTRNPSGANMVLNRIWGCSGDATSGNCNEVNRYEMRMGYGSRGGNPTLALVGLNRYTRFWHIQSATLRAVLENDSGFDGSISVYDINTQFDKDPADDHALFEDIQTGTVYGNTGIGEKSGYFFTLSNAAVDQYNWVSGNYDLGLALDNLSSVMRLTTAEDYPSLYVTYEPDSDGDNLTDDWENATGITNAYGDDDWDGVVNFQEYFMRTDPRDNDSDDDGMTDGYEFQTGLNMLLPDNDIDTDGDGLTNEQEIIKATSPINPDTDGDGILDGEDDVIDSRAGVLPVLVEVHNDWGTGYCANLIVNNNTNGPVDWKAFFTLEDTITQYWEVELEKTEELVTIQGVSWNNVLNAKSKSHSMGFCAERNSSSSSNQYPITVRARGTSGQERINLTVGGQLVASWTLTTGFNDYSINTNRSGGINVEFINDAQYRDVVVDYVSINNVVHQAEAQSSNTAAFGGGSCGGGSHTEWMHCNGYIGFSAYR